MLLLPICLPVALSSLLAFFFLFLWFIRQPRPVTIPVKNRHILITGGSSGIGLELAKLAAAEGATVSILARDPARLAAAQRSIAEFTGQQAQVLSADVRDFESVRVALERAGPVDILICSHGVSWPASLEDTSLDDMNQTLDINLKGCIHVIKAALPSMKNRSEKNPGCIAMISSQAGQVGIYGYTIYSASKFALRGLAEALQQELIQYNIRISIVYPPDTNTPMLIRENEQKPELTRVLASSSSTMEAVDVARKSLNGIKSGQFTISCNFEGLLLSTATMGMSPQPSLLQAFTEIAFSGVVRIIGFCILWGWYQKLGKAHGPKKGLFSN